MSINREATIRWKGYDPDNLKPNSNKRIWVNCDNCGKGRWVCRQDYHGLCRSCSHKGKKHTKEELEKMSKSQIGRRHSPETILKISKSRTGTKLSDEHKAKISKSLEGNQRTKGFHHSEKTRKQMSESHMDMVFSDEHIINMKKSESAKISQDKQRGGKDIVEHHYIYDHAHPELYTMKVTRKKHGQIHAWMRKAGIKVPHINEDVGEWRYTNVR